VGKSRGEKGHHKASVNLIRKHGNPLGWKAADLQRAAVVARFHRGILPTRKHKLLRDLLPDEQKTSIQLAAILRLANALDASHDGHIRRIQVENFHSVNSRIKHVGRGKAHSNGFVRKAARLAPNEALVIAAEGYSAFGSSAQTIAAERYLLETVLHRPVLIKPMKPQARTSLR
jgi:exopolyphosphatase/pppGpp-phosphohydrolase